MSHITIIIDAVAPVFADPEIREGLDAHDCARVDAILRKETHTKRDARRLLRVLEDSLMHGDDHGEGGVD